MAYKRQISYIDLIENELKRGNAGFIKWEKYDECHILSVFINGLKNIFNKEVNVSLENGHSIGKLSIKNGKAEGTFLITRGEKDWEPIIRVIRIPLDEEKELVAEFEGAERPVEIAEAAEEVASVEGQAEEKEKEPVTVLEKILPETVEREWDLDSKSAWEILSKTHELIYPFRNSVGCYRIFPKDINLLHENYHSLQNNQFLMHGYYNYRHLIIFPKKDDENEFWLGVPGIYHEREKIAARMFGFEKFEGTKKEYRVGDLGYYLITVKG